MNRRTLYRIIFADAADPLAPAQNPEGRFHHSGQWALYASLSSVGASTALRRYLSADDAPRVLHVIHLNTDLLDLTGDSSRARHGIRPEDLTARWEQIRAAGQRPPTWDVSDKLRAAGLAGFIYASRQAPDLHHAVLFAPGLTDSAGAPRPWQPPPALA